MVMLEVIIFVRLNGICKAFNNHFAASGHFKLVDPSGSLEEHDSSLSNTGESDLHL